MRCGRLRVALASIDGAVGIVPDVAIIRQAGTPGREWPVLVGAVPPEARRHRLGEGGRGRPGARPARGSETRRQRAGTAGVRGARFRRAGLKLVTLLARGGGTHGQSQALAAVAMARVMASRITDARWSASEG